MKQFIFLIFLFSFLITSCSPTPEEQARTDAMVAAQHGYDLLLQGNYDELVFSRAGMADAPRDYREQLVDAYKMYMASEQRAHQGISSAKATRAEIDSTLNLVQVFMLLTYGDSTAEEIVVPVVKDQGQWKLK